MDDDLDAIADANTVRINTGNMKHNTGSKGMKAFRKGMLRKPRWIKQLNSLQAWKRKAKRDAL